MIPDASIALKTLKLSFPPLGVVTVCQALSRILSLRDCENSRFNIKEN